MGGLIDAVGDGITGLISGAFATIGAVLRGLVNAGDEAIPGGFFFVLLFIAALCGAWVLAKR